MHLIIEYNKELVYVNYIFSKPNLMLGTNFGKHVEILYSLLGSS